MAMTAMARASAATGATHIRRSTCGHSPCRRAAASAAVSHSSKCRLAYRRTSSAPDRVDHHERLMREKRAVQQHLVEARRKVVALRSEVIAGT